MSDSINIDDEISSILGDDLPTIDDDIQDEE